VEDQPTDTSDLTDAGDASRKDATDGAAKPARGVPVGKRSGRHRTFRPRSVATVPAEDASADEAEAAPAAPGVTATEPSETESTEASEESTDAAVDDPDDTEAAPTSKRRGWFRGRSSKSSETPVGQTAEPAEAADSEPADGAVSEEAEEYDETEPATVKERKPAGKKMMIAVSVAAALFIGAGAFGGAMVQPYLSDRAAADTKLDIARTATDAITTLFTYTPEDMDQLAARSSKYLGGDLKDAYAKQVDALAATNKQSQIRRNAQVVGAAVESLQGTEATALVYANITYSSATTKEVPKLFLVSYRLTMQRKGDDWLITNMPWVTSKDLTKVMPGQ
jgi:Mce-associated membrane protein